MNPSIIHVLSRDLATGDVLVGDRGGQSFVLTSATYGEDTEVHTEHGALMIPPTAAAAILDSGPVVRQFHGRPVIMSLDQHAALWRPNDDWTLWPSITAAAQEAAKG